MVLPAIQDYCQQLTENFGSIPAARKVMLERIARFIADHLGKNKKVQLVYICTHNSRRSHFGQVWARVAAAYYGIKNVDTYSGGTEVTAFHPNAIAALKRAGFRVESDGRENNPAYRVYYGSENDHVLCFSKRYNDPENPDEDFAAVMTCGEAEQNCPFIPGAALRVATPYQDPKAADNTPAQDDVYDERCRQIALETLFVFSLLKT